MSFKFNPLLKRNFDYFENGLVVSATAPENPSEGQFYVNSSDNTLYVFWETWRSTGITVPSTAGLYMGFGAFTYSN